MTGEPDEMKKDSIQMCKVKQIEKDTELATEKSPRRHPHDLPSPLMMSGTQIATGEGWYMTLVVGKRT